MRAKVRMQLTSEAEAVSLVAMANAVVGRPAKRARLVSRRRGRATYLSPSAGQYTRAQPVDPDDRGGSWEVIVDGGLARALADPRKASRVRPEQKLALETELGRAVATTSRQRRP